MSLNPNERKSKGKGKMLKKYIPSSLLIVGLVVVVNVSAETVNFNKTKDWNGPIKEATVNGTTCLKAIGISTLKSKKVFLFDPQKIYTISAEAKSIGDNTSTVLLGFQCFDSRNQHIKANFVKCLPKTETMLAAPCKPKDKIIMINDGAKWNHNKWLSSYIAFEVDDSGKYADLPNKNLSPKIIQITKKEGVWNIHLEAPCRKNYPAGTKVREHENGNAYTYSAAGKKLPSQWTIIKGTAKGFFKGGSFSAKSFRPGTKYIRVIALLNLGDNKRQTSVAIKNIKLEISE